ncbi:MAG: GntR family transcriptional regulator [Rhizobiales bacterium]|nr:GntR family transcriptional regulator [Hyphomicrobiales bacterium]MBO6697703.1 GntR family transcriptional regulator [Hyphomicrobiales bacterium]MBO6736042.1 GntR family transcriptional regulator [Hyphomicrobiales bacterium]MBO6912512.1 GntR family transcriptional regulator [Hyphomicrobiales bacterium]MBO6956353.1 GntR family transcriptional regulator [Hyphomicrobiales bacterium]
METLRDPIETGEWPAGAKLPIELELAAHFRVNRHTVRRALAELARDGLVATTQGRGTFITAGIKAQYRVNTNSPLSDTNWLNVEELTSAFVRHRKVEAGTRMGQDLDLVPTDQVHEVELILGADGSPLALATIWMPTRFFPHLNDALRKAGSIEGTLKAYGFAEQVTRRTRVIARLAGERESALLKSKDPLPMSVVESVIEVSQSLGAQRPVTTRLMVHLALCGTRADVVIGDAPEPA